MAALESSPRPIVVVTEGGPHIWAIVNALADRAGPVSVILETPESKKRLLLGRARRQGWISAIGQLGTMVLTRLGKRFLAGHAARLVAKEKLETEPRPGQAIVHVPSADGPECLETIRKIRPGVVLLAGCRLLSKDTLANMPCPVLNYHAGIAPKYRGMNGGYWALASGDPENFGTTVHLVDAGVDTGGVLKQARGKPKHGDTIASYALRQA
ncbi:MAG: formyl transferase, partial [Mesorhizobium sp.]